MKPQLVRLAGLATTLLYSALVVGVYARQPRTLAQLAGSVTSTVGAYRIDEASFQEALAFFRNGQYPEARAAFVRADPAIQDPVTQFYTAYAFYRQGWGRVYSDDVLFAQGMEAVNRAIALAPNGRVAVPDPDLGMHTADELKAELERGLTKDLTDLNPLKVLRERK